MAVLTPRGRDGTDQFLNGRDRSAHGHPVFVHGDPGWRSPSALSRTLPRALASRISAKVEPAPRYSQAGDVTGAAEAALALQRVGDAAFDASHRAYLRARRHRSRAKDRRFHGLGATDRRKHRAGRHSSGVVLSAAGQEASALTPANAPLGRPSTPMLSLFSVQCCSSRRADGPQSSRLGIL